MAVIDTSEFTVNVVAGMLPNITAVAPVNPAPRRFTAGGPPVSGPELGETPVTLMRYVNVSALLVTEVPYAVVTVTSTGPGEPEGDIAVMDVERLTVTFGEAAPPKLTLVVPMNPVPVIVTLVPPVAGPVVGATLITVGA
jgi:hypothetical protein